jgi:hypothetical protein
MARPRGGCTSNSEVLLLKTLSNNLTYVVYAVAGAQFDRRAAATTRLL